MITKTVAVDREFIKLEFLERHVNSCGYSPTRCINAGCPEVINRHEKEQHEREQCRFRKIVCDECGEPVIWKSNRVHPCFMRKEMDDLARRLNVVQNDMREFKDDVREVKEKVEKVELTQEEMVYLTKEATERCNLFTGRQKIRGGATGGCGGVEHPPTRRGGANPLLMGGCEGSFCRLFGNFAESLAYSKSTFKCVLLYPLLSRFSTSEFFRANRNVMRNRPVEKELRDLFPLSTSILIRLADVISDTDKGKRSFRARKFASGKPTLSPLLLNSNKRYLLKLLHAISYREP